VVVAKKSRFHATTAKPARGSAVLAPAAVIVQLANAFVARRSRYYPTKITRGKESGSVKNVGGAHGPKSAAAFVPG
jgi:hypothetical protein